MMRWFRIIIAIIFINRYPKRTTQPILKGINTSRVMTVCHAAATSNSCRKVIYYPRNDGRWDLIECPLPKGHKGLHADINYAPFWTDEDAELLNAQYKLVTER
jgi:hypothetical protein